MMKTERQNRILELVSTKKFSTQDQLLDQLLSEGFRVTQATVSRDLRELKLVKQTASDGTCHYTPPYEHTKTVGPRFNSSLTDSIKKVDCAGNLIVIKTDPGMAQAVATCIDSMDEGEIIGCVAGDDAILVVVSENHLATVICHRLRKLLRHA